VRPVERFMSKHETYRPVKELQFHSGIVLVVAALVLCLVSVEATTNILPIVDIDSQCAGPGDLLLGLVMGLLGLLLIRSGGRKP